MIKDKQELSVKIQQYKLERIADELIALAKPSIFMLSAAVDDASIAVGSSKFGGDPDLPPEFEWKYCKGKPLSFIGQFRLSELAPFDTEHILPSTGILHLFVDLWGDHDQSDGWQIVFTDNAKSPLVRIPHPRVPWLQGRIEALPPHRIDFAGGITLPTGFGGPAAYGIVLEGDQDQYGMTSEESAYWDLIDAEYPMPCHYFLGYPNQIQDSINEDEFLFQIDTDDRLNVMWGDVGILYACIPKSSLEKRSFKDCEITQEGY